MDDTKRLKDCAINICPNLTTLIEKSLLVVLFLLVLTGCLSIPISMWWQTENTAHHSRTIPLNEHRTITVDYPAIVLLEDKPASISLSLATTPPLTQPLTVTVQLPRELVLAAPPQTYRDSEPSLTFPPSAARVQTQTLQIANARLVGGLGQTQAITLTTLITQPVSLPIRIEGTWRVSLRGFFSNQFNIIITALLSAAGLLFTLFQKQREADESRRREKVEEEKREKEERRNQADHEKEKFRELVRQHNCTLALGTFQNLQKQSLLDLITPGERTLMEHLLAWSRGELTELNLEKIPLDWLNEVAGALVYAFNEGHGNILEIKSLLRQLPADRLSNDVRDAVQAAIDLPEQARACPPPLQEPNWALIAPGEPWKERLPVNPFPYEYAEDDFQVLFSKVGAFWSEHRLYKRIAENNKSEIIVGEGGTGKTAMALALGEYSYDSETLACYLSGLPEERDIQYALARKILAFVCRHPTFLRKLGQDNRALLAGVCASALGAHYVLAALDSVPIEEMNYVLQATNNRQKRENIIRAQLRLFRDTIVSLPADRYSSFCEWSGALAHCARALEFNLPIHVVIDATGGQCAEWINQFTLPRISRWRMNKIIAKIFVSSSVGSAITLPEDHSGWLGYLELKWDDSLLSQMLDHRFESIMIAGNSRVRRSEIVSDGLWNQMLINARGNPRCFIRLWNRMLVLATDGVLSETVLVKALEGFECP